MSGQIRFFLDWKEYFAAREFLRASRTPVVPEKIGGGLLIAMGALLYFFSDLNLAAFGALALGLIFSFGIPAFRRQVAKRKWGREPLYRMEQALSFGEEGIILQMGPIESNLNWQYYRGALESPDGFLLISYNDAFNFLPKRAFDSEIVINEFRALTQKKLKK
jgi:hypothetical protein